jgi:hypothetical protein
MRAGLYKIILSLALLVGVVCSCSEEIINIDFSAFEKSIVIEGIISDNLEQCEVKVSRVEGYFEDNIQSTVSDALVIVYDDYGALDTLNVKEPGLYVSTSITGVPGHTYFLKVIADGKEFFAVSKMPEPMEFSSVKSEYAGSNRYNLILTINDKKNVEEYCKILIYQNGNKKGEKLYNGSHSDGDVVTIVEENFYRKDRAVIELVTVPKTIYKYFSDLKELTENDNSETVELIQLAAGNPKSNISNNALGYFSAQTYKIYNKHF